MKPKVHFIILLWGEDYTASFLNYTLPMLIAQGNLDVFYGHDGFLVHLLTTKESLLECNQNKLFRSLKRKMEVKVTTFEHLQENCYLQMTLLHQEAIAFANKKKAAFGFIFPDMLISNGTLLAAYRELQKGYDAIFTAAPRVDRTKILYAMSGLSWNKDGILSVPPELLTKLCLARLHPWNKACFFEDARKHTETPAQIYWGISSGNVLVKGFHYHPLLINPKDRKYVQTGTLDFDYVDAACENPVLIPDNKEICIFEYSDADTKTGDILKGKQDVELIARWSKHHANKTHMNLFGQHTELLTTYGGLPKLSETIEKANAVEAKVRRMLQKPSDRIVSFTEQLPAIPDLPPQPVNGTRLKKFECKESCFYRSHLYKKGDFLTTLRMDVPRFFVEIK